MGHKEGKRGKEENVHECAITKSLLKVWGLIPRAMEPVEDFHHVCEQTLIFFEDCSACLQSETWREHNDFVEIYCWFEPGW